MAPSPPPGAERVGGGGGVPERWPLPTPPSHASVVGPPPSPLKAAGGGWLGGGGGGGGGASVGVFSGHPAVLDQLSDPGLCLDRAVAAERARQPAAPRRGARRGAGTVALQRVFGRARARLLLSPV